MKKGFTLIELLIVIAIIGILAVALLPAITGGPAKARDAARIAAVNNIVTAVESIALAGSIPATSGCLVASAEPGTAISAELKGLPNIQSATFTALCASGRYYYGKLSNGYYVATEVENPGNANVESATTGTLMLDPNGAGTGLGAASDVLALQDGTLPTTCVTGATTVTTACFYVDIK